MNRKSILWGLVLVSVFGSVAVAGAAQKEQPKKAEAAAKAPAARWDAVLQAAKGEGSLIVYSTANPATKLALTKAMKEKYGIAVDFIIGRGEQLVQRIYMENQAGIYQGDVLLVGGTTLQLTLKPGYTSNLDSVLILPEVADPTRWRGQRIPFLDKDHQIIGFVNKSGSYVAVNTDAIKPGEIKSFRDLTDPKWKGKIIMDDPTITGAADDWAHLMLVIFGHEKGKEYLQQLAKQDLVVLRDKRLVVEWLARNKYPIAIGPDAQTYSEFRSNGAPIAYIKMSEGSGSTSSGGCISILKRAAHPNASLVFLNWLLTREGQTIFQKSFGAPSARVDVDLTGMDPGFIPQEGEKLFSAMSAEWYASKAAGMEVVNQIFKPLMK